LSVASSLSIYSYFALQPAMACTKHSSQANCIHLSVFESSFATIIQAQRVIFLLETTCNTFPVDKANCRLRQYGSSIFIPTVFLFAPYFHAYCRDSPSGHRLWRLHSIHCHTNSADLDLDCNLNFDMPKTLHGSRRLNGSVENATAHNGAIVGSP